jgi:deferrochelatase/peroxidase EfeB
VKIDRRRFLTRSALALGAVAGVEAAAAAEAGAPALAAAPDTLRDRLPFDGPHQAGILTAPRDAVTLAALDAVAPDRARLIQGLQALSSRARELAHGAKLPVEEVDDPPADSGILGTEFPPDALTVTIAFGASLFDGRYGLAHRRPAELQRMAPFPNDRLDPALTHGDVLLALSAHRADTVSHALRELLRPVRDALAPRWWIDGFQGAARGPSPRSSPRNLFGFRDGTGNPDTADDALMRRLVWTPDGGTYVAVRLIRMQLEFWDRVGLREQETMIGRRRDTGAPLGGHDEYEDPRYDQDPEGERIALDSHIRLANPRTPGSEDQRLLRRAWNYQRGFDPAGQLDQGLIFLAYNQAPARQFLTVQRRLDGEPLTDYITPVGGGYFYAPRGARGPGDWVGSGLF